MFNYLKKTFQKPENGLMQIILLQIILFASIQILKAICHITGSIALDRLYTHTCLYSGEILNKPWTLLTHFFLHDSLLKLLFNISALYTFGRFTVYFLGNKKFLTLYITGGILGGLVFAFSYNFLPFLITIKQQALQNHTNLKLLGSSAALYAVIAGTVAFAPNLELLPFSSIKIKYIAWSLLTWTLLQLVYGNNYEVQHIARLGSACWGYAYIQYLRLYQHENWRTSWHKLYHHLKKLHNNFINQHTQPSPNNKDPEKQPHKPISKQEIDKILDKIALYGYAKLTYQEKKKLFDGGKSL